MYEVFLELMQRSGGFLHVQKSPFWAFVVLEASLASFLTVGRCKPYFKTVGGDGSRCKEWFTALRMHS